MKNCPKCHKKLKEVGLKASENGVMYSDVSLDSAGDIQWEQKEFENNYTPEIAYYCGDCGELLGWDLSEEKIKEILK